MAATGSAYLTLCLCPPCLSVCCCAAVAGYPDFVKLVEVGPRDGLQNEVR